MAACASGCAGSLSRPDSEAFDDPALFADVEGVLRAAVSTPEHGPPDPSRSCSASPTPGA